jgi:hypothetical protein
VICVYRGLKNPHSETCDLQVSNRLYTWGGEFDFEVSVPPTLDFACFESILFKKAYYDIISSGLKLIKMAYLPPKYGQNMDFSLLAESNGYI